MLCSKVKELLGQNATDHQHGSHLTCRDGQADSGSCLHGFQDRPEVEVALISPQKDVAQRWVPMSASSI